jgi:hypothetical protein
MSRKQVVTSPTSAFFVILCKKKWWVPNTNDESRQIASIPLFSPKRPHVINLYKKIIICDSNVYKCLPAITFCPNIFLLFYYIFINLFIKIINLINDDRIKSNLYVPLIITIIIRFITWGRFGEKRGHFGKRWERFGSGCILTCCPLHLSSVVQNY